jgi:uncharacterized Zn finger protein (UPF0148 family)
MGFNEKIKLEAKKMANFRCCMCRALIVDVHHLLPQKDGGDDSLQNAATLCGACHRTYGNNPDHRKTIKDMRDHWHAICEQQNKNFPTDKTSMLEKIDRLDNNIGDIKLTLANYFKEAASQIEKAQSLENISTVTHAVSSGSGFDIFEELGGVCPECGYPLERNIDKDGSISASCNNRKCIERMNSY